MDCLCKVGHHKSDVKKSIGIYGHSVNHFLFSTDTSIYLVPTLVGGLQRLNICCEYPAEHEVTLVVQ